MTTTPRAPPISQQIEAPLLSAGNWGGVGLHTRGNFEGWLRAGSKQKWLEVHGDTHFTHFYSNTAKLCRSASSATSSRARTPAGASSRAFRSTSATRAKNSCCAPRTNGRSRARNGRNISCSRTAKASAPTTPKAATTLSYETTGDGLTFSTPPLTKSLEITGPVAAKLWVSSETTDADLFLVLRLFDPAGKEVTFIGSNDPRTPVGLGWLRASQRKLDPKMSRPYRPWHTHDEEWPLKPGEPVELDVEIWPTCIVVPPGYRLALTRARQGLRSRRQRRGAPQRALPDEGRRAFPAYRPGRPAAGDFRRPQHAALCRRQAAIPLVAGHSRGRKLPSKRSKQGGSNDEAHCCRCLERAWLVGFRRPGRAQDYPDRTVTIVVPYPAGGPTDQTRARGREKLSKKFGQNFIVENVTGGSTIIATNKVAKADAGRLHAAAAQSADFREPDAVQDLAVRHAQGHQDGDHDQPKSAGSGRPPGSGAEHRSRTSSR